MSLSRRALLAGAPGAVAAVPAMAEAASQSLANAAKAIMRAPGFQVAASPQGDAGKLLTEEQRALDALRYQISEKRAMRRRFAVRGLDPDIAALRLPRATQVRMQMEREAGEQTLLDRLRDLIFPQKDRDPANEPTDSYRATGQRY